MRKIIHYCWFGRNKKSKLIKRCMASWKKYCPDWEIIEWNEDNFNININVYVRQAYDKKKWAFVSDYCRFFALYNHGGIYLDTDVELIAPLDNLPESFVSFENVNHVNSGLIRGANEGDCICKKILDDYDSSQFLNIDGSISYLTVCDRETSLLKQLGLRCDGSYQKLNGITVFPQNWFNPKSQATGEIIITPETRSIHHFEASWFPAKYRFVSLILKFLYKYFGENTTRALVDHLRSVKKNRRLQTPD